MRLTLHVNGSVFRRKIRARYLLFYDECELEWIALAGAGPAERIEFHKNLPELQMITELNARVHYLKKVLEPAPRVR